MVAPISLFDFADRMDAIAKDDFLCRRLLPERYIHPLFPPVEIRILVFADGNGGFDERDFGLAELIRVLTVAPGPWVRILVTTAHRADDPSAMLKSFVFSDATLAGFDQLWLFGVERTSSYLSDDELRSISQFMNDGGGVFATGDHENLGEALCSRIPRVRSMRAWYWPDPGPNEEPSAPIVNTEDRHDTLTRRGNEAIAFDHQSDDVPQRIHPVMTVISSGLRDRVFPHEVLCSPLGVIDVMPDHPHEGVCYETTDTARSFSFSGVTFVEYPTAADGSQPLPRVIAESQHASRSADDEKGALKAKTFGSIAVYDGHHAAVGRVLTDSTWHHFFNINLKGNPASPDPLARVGFAGSLTEEGKRSYDLIKAYFRNIAVYLARSDQHARMQTRAVWFARFDSRVAMDLRVGYIDRLDEPAKLLEYVRVGKIAREALEQFASRCEVIRWTFDLTRVPKLVRRWVPPLDPISLAGLETPPPEVFDVLEPALLGAAIYAAAEAAPGFYDRTTIEKLGDAGLAKVLDTSAQAALRMGFQYLQGRTEIHRSFASEAITEHD